MRRYPVVAADAERLREAAREGAAFALARVSAAGLARMTPPALLALLSSAALTPLALASPDQSGLAWLGVATGVGTNVLSQVIRDGVAALRRRSAAKEPAPSGTRADWAGGGAGGLGGVGQRPGSEAGRLRLPGLRCAAYRGGRDLGRRAGGSFPRDLHAAHRPAPGRHPDLARRGLHRRRDTATRYVLRRQLLVGALFAHTKTPIPGAQASAWATRRIRRRRTDLLPWRPLDESDPGSGWHTTSGLLVERYALVAADGWLLLRDVTRALRPRVVTDDYAQDWAKDVLGTPLAGIRGPGSGLSGRDYLVRVRPPRKLIVARPRNIAALD